MKSGISQLRFFHWRLWGSLCALAFIPAVYQTVRTFLIASGGQSGAFDIIGQMEWFDLINETLQAFLIVPLYSVLNRAYKACTDKFAAVTFKTGLCAFLLYTVFSLGVLTYGTMLIRAMNPAEIDLTVTAAYHRLETLAFMTGIPVGFANVVFVVIGRARNISILLILRTALSLAADFLLIPNLWVYGVAVSNILTNTLLFAGCVLLLSRQGFFRPGRFCKADRPLLLEWCRIGIFSGFQQFLDNFIYAVMVCKMVNMAAEAGNYWIANNFIWGWLLIPISALSEVIRSDCKDGYPNLRQFNYYFLAAASAALWFLTMPVWTGFFRYVQHLENPEEIFSIAARLIPFYLAHAVCTIIDSIFTGLGKTVYPMVNSLIINLGYYGIFYLLYRTGILTFDLNTILYMFGFGMVVHEAISLIEEKLFFRKSMQNARPCNTPAAEC